MRDFALPSWQPPSRLHGTKRWSSWEAGTTAEAAAGAAARVEVEEVEEVAEAWGTHGYGPNVQIWDPDLRAILGHN